MCAKSWFEAFQEWGNVIFTEADFQEYLAIAKSSLPFYKGYLREGSRILEPGCGLGVTSIPLSALGFSMVGIDNDPRVVEAAKTNAKHFGRDIEIVHGDIFDIDALFAPDSFDACISGGVLEHFSEAQIAELARKQLVVAPLLIASMPLASFPGERWDDGIERNLWDPSYWMGTIFRDFNVVGHRVQKASEAIGGFLELEVVIRR